MCIYGIGQTHWTSSPLSLEQQTEVRRWEFARVKEELKWRPDDLYFFPSRDYHASYHTAPEGNAFPKKGENVYYKMDILCQSLGGRNVYLLTITDTEILQKNGLYDKQNNPVEVNWKDHGEFTTEWDRDIEI